MYLLYTTNYNFNREKVYTVIFNINCYDNYNLLNPKIGIRYI